MRKIEFTLIGIGSGNPDHLTLEAIKAIARADLILLPSKGAEKSGLLAIRQEICRTHGTNPDGLVEFDMPKRDPSIKDYQARVENWHDEIALIWREMIEAHKDAQHVALLIWGDPALYDSALRIAGRLHGVFDLHINVVPGITSIQALTAAHQIPLNDLGDAYLVTTGRQLRENGWPAGVSRAVVMLDGENSFQMLEAQDQYDIFWTAYAGMDWEISISGHLPSVASEIVKTRNEQRALRGWIMDIYLLTKRR